ncbi:uncharacterized protein LOC107783216 [Nicotiana tabacum]|uniref:Uncharacterized protein LOC107783216 n=1 Tax=Nicotiana tabacum TaxID=4097 RepID=A0A1S3Z5K5_TOBAC
MVDCRSLIEFCRAYEQHKNMIKFNSHINKKHSYNNQKNSFCCDHSPFAVSLDALILLLVLGSLGFLLIPYFKLIFTQISPIIVEVLIEVINNSPVAYFVGLFVALIGVIILIVIWEIVDLRSRKCGNPNCQGLRRAVEFDIQLESEDCIKCLPSDRDLNSSSFYDYGVKPLELGEERKELEAELKRMAPRNGRTVLIFRAPCGCPAGTRGTPNGSKMTAVPNNDYESVTMRFLLKKSFSSSFCAYDRACKALLDHRAEILSWGIRSDRDANKSLPASLGISNFIRLPNC